MIIKKRKQKEKEKQKEKDSAKNKLLKILQEKNRRYKDKILEEEDFYLCNTGRRLTDEEYEKEQEFQWRLSQLGGKRRDYISDQIRYSKNHSYSRNHRDPLAQKIREWEEEAMEEEAMKREMKERREREEKKLRLEREKEIERIKKKEYKEKPKEKEIKETKRVKKEESKKTERKEKPKGFQQPIYVEEKKTLSDFSERNDTREYNWSISLANRIKGVGRGERICRLALEEIYKTPFRKIRPEFLKNPETKRCLEIDCFGEIPKGKLAVEYQGQQHYEYQEGKSIFLKSEEDFIKQVRRDMFKKEQLELNNIYFIEVPYNIEYKDIGVYLLDELRIMGLL